MAEASQDLEGPDFERGCDIDKVPGGEMLLGHAFGEAVLLARRGDELFAIGATCTHYGGPLAKGLMVDCTVHCPWHHARFDLRTGEAIAAPALNNVTRYKIDKRGEQFFVTGKVDEKPVRKPKSSPSSVVIVGAGAAGSAAAEMLRREGYEGPVTLIGADESLPYYYNYAFATVFKFQLHDYIARKILHQPPQSCNYADNKEVGTWFNNILKKGGTEDWRKVLKEATGEDISTRAMMDYFKPLMSWLEEQNKGRQIGWD